MTPRITLKEQVELVLKYYRAGVDFKDAVLVVEQYHDGEKENKSCAAQ
jgi:hypothetical protein